MAEPKILPPSLRSHKRYIVFDVISEQPIVYGELVNAIWDSMFNFLGELGASEAQVWFIHNIYDEKNQRCIIKCKHDSVEKIRVMLSLIQVVGDIKCIIKILGVTGTIKSARTKYFAKSSLKDFAQE
jgi:ribonuclease P/MRP protein subunit POP5